MGARGSLGQAVYDYIESGNDCFLVSADLMHASGFDRVLQKYPDKCVDVGIAEQNLIGVSAGLSRNSMPVVATTWAMFAAIRALDQVRNFMGYMQSNVKLIGMDSGLAKTNFGYSHSNPPDITVMRAIPGITILSPCDGVQIYQSIISALDMKGPVYVRLPGGNSLPPIYDENYRFEIGESDVLEDGEDVAIIATGGAVPNALKVIKTLKEAGLSVKLVNMHTINPLDSETLDELADYPMVFTVEDHLLNGGLGSSVSEYYSSRSDKPRILSIGIKNEYTPSGTKEYVEDLYGLSPQKIAERIMTEVKTGLKN